MGQIARIIAPALAIAIALVTGLAAAAPAINIATYKGADREKLILEGAKRERKVSVYSGMIENQALRPLVEAFEKKYPFVDVEYWRGDSRAMVQKLLSEQRARRIIGDIFESTGGAEAVIRAGASQPIWSPSAASYPQNLIDPDRMWIASRLNYFGVAYNTRQVQPPDLPKTYEDLLDPKWRGAISWRADSEVGAGLFIASVLRSMGKQVGENYLRRLSAQRIVNYAGSARALVDRVGEGEYKLALHIYAHHPLISQAKGAPLDVQMLEPVPSMVSTVQLAKGAPHPHASMLFIDFVLSKEGQETLRAADYMSPHPEVAINPSLRKIVPRFNNAKELVFTPELMFETRAQANAMFEKYFR
jgi:ABC-type Fe3+ transport system substrate-binding protein